MSGVRWDVFCRVVDNYGDAGVCWRLARQLHAEHAADVTLWIDRLSTLARFEPGIDIDIPRQLVAGVTLRSLAHGATTPALPDVVVEAFGCGLPPHYLGAMAQAPSPPIWFNLEYLSAEPWVDSVHGLASPQPRLPLARYFWFPGFTSRTGGLIREAGLLARRDAVQAACDDERALRVTLFVYANRALPALFDAWAEADESIACAIPDGVATAALDQWLQGDVPHAGQSILRGRLRIDVIPFATQDAFDRRLWQADINFVRGEDSFVRAQWAARAFVWQPYPQDDEAHRLKMEAFLARYATDIADDARNALLEFWRAFNAEDGSAVAAAWPAFRDARETLGRHGRRWSDALSALPDLTAGLVDFAADKLLY